MAETAGAALNYSPMALWMALSLYAAVKCELNVTRRSLIAAGIAAVALVVGAGIADIVFFHQLFPVLLLASWLLVLALALRFRLRSS